MQFLLFANLYYHNSSMKKSEKKIEDGSFWAFALINGRLAEFHYEIRKEKFYIIEMNPVFYIIPSVLKIFFMKHSNPFIFNKKGKRTI